MTPDLLSVAQVCEQLGLSDYRVRADVAAGIFPCRRPGRLVRFTAEDVATYVQRIAYDGGSSHSGQTKASLRRFRSARGAP